MGVKRRDRCNGSIGRSGAAVLAVVLSAGCTPQQPDLDDYRRSRRGVALGDGAPTVAVVAWSEAEATRAAVRRD